MRAIGMILILAGTILISIALSMDTSVEVNYPSGNKFNLPERVNNIGLMADKQNYLILGCFLFVIGLVLGYKKNDEAEKTCPKCAEKVKKEAIICKHCKTEFKL